VTPQKGTLNLWASLGGLGLVSVVLAGDWKGRNRRRIGAVLAVLAVIFLITLVGCGSGSSGGGGGGGGGGGTGGTPAGTYAVKVTVTGTGNTSPSNGPLTVTLVVN
jgi:peptidoglycan/LPS O-acetylase OafA/YrhL